MYDVNFEGLLSLADAAKIWMIDDSTIRKAIAAGRLVQGRDCQKYGKQWVVTVDAMAKEFKGGYGPWKIYHDEKKKAEKAAELENQIKMEEIEREIQKEYEERIANAPIWKKRETR